jgi:D-arabinose 5-phosphate isomerase GutQ
MSAIEHEIASQPAVWRRAADLAPSLTSQLPPAGARLAVIGCGTSLYMAQAFAAARETAGAGETDAFPASELPPGRRYDALLAISRSGTTTEVVRALATLPPSLPTYVIVGTGGTPAAATARHTVVLDFADEASVVQTRFATTTLVLLLAGLGLETERATLEAELALNADLPGGVVSRARVSTRPDRARRFADRRLAPRRARRRPGRRHTSDGRHRNRDEPPSPRRPRAHPPRGPRDRKGARARSRPPTEPDPFGRPDVLVKGSPT